MSDPISPVIQSAPPATTQEPIQSEMPPADSPMCGWQGASTAGAEALVRRFSDASGAGGAPGATSMNGSDCASMPEPSSCDDEAVTAAALCGTAVVVAAGSGGIGALFGGALCAMSLGSLLNCVVKDEGSKP